MAKVLIPKQRKLTKKGNIISIVAWSVPKSKEYKEGINYSFQLVHKNKRVLGYDNNTSEGHHKHCLRDNKLVKENIKFENLSKIYQKFLNDVKKFEEGLK